MQFLVHTSIRPFSESLSSLRGPGELQLPSLCPAQPCAAEMSPWVHVGGLGECPTFLQTLKPENGLSHLDMKSFENMAY